MRLPAAVDVQAQVDIRRRVAERLGCPLGKELMEESVFVCDQDFRRSGPKVGIEIRNVPVVPIHVSLHRVSIRVAEMSLCRGAHFGR